MRTFGNAFELRSLSLGSTFLQWSGLRIFWFKPLHLNPNKIKTTLKNQIFFEITLTIILTHTQLGDSTAGPSPPICATCFTSVGCPICNSCSFSSSAPTMSLIQNIIFCKWKKNINIDLLTKYLWGDVFYASNEAFHLCAHMQRYVNGVNVTPKRCLKLELDDKRKEIKWKLWEKQFCFLFTHSKFLHVGAKFRDKKRGLPWFVLCASIRCAFRHTRC